MANDDTSAVIRPRGSITTDCCEDLRVALLELLNAGATAIEVDLGGVDMIDSRGLSVLVQCHQSLTERGGTITITHASDDIRRLFRVTRLDASFRIAPSADAA